MHALDWGRPKSNSQQVPTTLMVGATFRGRCSSSKGLSAKCRVGSDWVSIGWYLDRTIGLRCVALLYPRLDIFPNNQPQNFQKTKRQMEKVGMYITASLSLQ